MQTDIPDILKPSDIAKHLNISKNTVYSMLSQDIIKGFRVGNNKLWRVFKEDFNEYLDSARYR